MDVGNAWAGAAALRRSPRGPALHSTTRSARASNDDGTMSLRAFAVLRLIDSSNLMLC